MHRIALNGRFSGTPQPTGTQTASYQLFDALVRASREIELVIFADSSFLQIAQWKEFSGVRWIETPFRNWSRSRAQAWEQLQFPRLAKQQGCQIAHHPMTTSPIWQHGLKTVVTLHDLNFYLHPEWYSKAFRLVYSLCAIPGLRRAAQVVTISHYVEQQAQAILRIPAARLSMIYNGVKPLFSTHAPQEKERYFLGVGSLQPHKNLTRMIQAFQQIRNHDPHLELRIVGRPQPRFTQESALPVLLASPGVRLLGYLSETELADQYAGALAFCFPSLEEGFGLPLLEAMGLGTPVLSSSVSCLPEIAGPKAVLVNPLDTNAIASGLQQILNWTPAQRQEAIEAGKLWTQRFSWQHSATKYLALYHSLLP